MNKAAFIDRDGTIIDEKHYIADPDDVVLADGAVEGLRALRSHGFKLIVVTNQSGIARGLYKESDFHAVQARLETMLKEHGVSFDAVYFCPHHPDFSGPCDCRKPGPGMYENGRRNLGVDLAHSVFIGDRIKDVLAAQHFGGLGILVHTGYGREEARSAPEWVLQASNLAAAADYAKKWLPA